MALCFATNYTNFTNGRNERIMEIITDDIRAMKERFTRRAFLGRGCAGLGSLALALLVEPKRLWSSQKPAPEKWRGVLQPPHFPARAKRIIFLFMPGGPSQVDTFDPKPRLTQDHGKPAHKLYLGQKRNLLASSSV